MNIIVKILIALFVCAVVYFAFRNASSLNIRYLLSPLSGPVDADKSNNYYYGKFGGIYYSSNGNWLEIGEKKLDVDKDTFVVLSSTVAKDANHVYFNGHTLEMEVDIDSFDVIHSGLVKDKNSLYGYRNYHEGPEVYVLENSDPESYEALLDEDPYWGRDKHNIYVNNIILSEADYDSFEIVDTFWARDDNNVYYGEQIVSHDPENFIIANECYGYDSKNLYYLKYDTDNINLLFITLPVGPIEDFTIIHTYLAHDNNKVYRRGKIIEGADPATFKVLRSPPPGGLFFGSTSEYFTDKNYVYKNTEPIVGADPDSFQLIHDESAYAKDKRNAYYDGEIIEGANPDTLKYVECKMGSYAKDANQVYYKGIPLEEADPKTIEVYSHMYTHARDKEHYYQDGKLITDAKRIKQLEHMWAK